MTNLSKTTARRNITLTLAALVLAAAIPQAGFAATSDNGTWKVDNVQDVNLALAGSVNSGGGTPTTGATSQPSQPQTSSSSP